MAQDNEPDVQVEGWLKTLGIESLCQWDVLVFLYRHQPTLVSAEQIARFLGYATAEVVAALDSLESSGLVERSRVSQGVRHRIDWQSDLAKQLVERSRVSQGVRLHQLTAPADPTRRDALERLMTLADSHTVRRLLARRLRGSDRAAQPDQNKNDFPLPGV
jgi:DNA-binding MarR family transcriptional regulator